MAGHPTAPNARRRGLGRGPMYEFEYQKPASLDDVARLLSDEDAKLVAGGMTLIPTLKQRLAKPTQLIDLASIPSLKGIKEEGDAIVIGAMTRHADVNRSDVVKRAIPALAADRFHGVAHVQDLHEPGLPSQVQGWEAHLGPGVRVGRACGLSICRSRGCSRIQQALGAGERHQVELRRPSMASTRCCRDRRAGQVGRARDHWRGPKSDPYSRFSRSRRGVVT